MVHLVNAAADSPAKSADLAVRSLYSAVIYTLHCYLLSLLNPKAGTDITSSPS